MKTILCILLSSFLLPFTRVQAQTVSGQFTGYSNAQLELIGFNGAQPLQLGSTVTDVKGNFELNYKNYQGIAYLRSETESELLVVIDAHGVQLMGTNLTELDSLQFIDSPENSLFEAYTKAYVERENALSGWLYLLRQYEKTESTLPERKKALQQIKTELHTFAIEDNKELSKIDTRLYASWYLPLRKLIASTSTSVDRYWERIPDHIDDFRAIDFNDVRFKTSGLRNDLIESHYWMLENSGGGLDSIAQKMNESTDYILQNVSENEPLYNELSSYLLKMLEKRSLFASAEYLSLKLLSEEACTLDEKLSNRAELYRTMKVGKITADIEFPEVQYRNGVKVTESESLGNMKNSYTLLVFGASWCQKCQEELFELTKVYSEWNKKGLEIVFISLDEDPTTFANFSKIFPWLSVCDFKGWNGKAVKDYYVFGSPTMFLLDENRTIVERIYSVDQVKTLMTNGI
jgi:thiol-disulfide isomerase/thioredoxin